MKLELLHEKSRLFGDSCLIASNFNKLARQITQIALLPQRGGQGQKTGSDSEYPNTTYEEYFLRSGMFTDLRNTHDGAKAETNYSHTQSE